MTLSAPPREYQPALDGVRGIAVSLVLLFHGGFAWMTGGYVGVSVFFTLSGFLITGLLLAEHQRSGAVSLRAFYARRIRRLLPASLCCLAAVVLLAAAGEFQGVPHLERDVLAALAQVANWNALAGGTSYADLVARNAGSLGPVDHFWSLSIEEQFYWLWPLVCAWWFARSARRAGDRTVRNGIVVAAVVAVAVAPWVAHVWGPDAAYWATPARLGEILVGAALAAVLHLRPLGDGAAMRRSLHLLGVVGLGVVVWAAVWWPADRGPAYEGWLGVFALASAALVLGLQVPGTLRSLCSVRPLVHLGRISYGVYLYHWPVFALLPATRVGWHGWPLFALRLAVTLAVAELSFWCVEQPVRRGTGGRVRLARNAVLAMAVVAAMALALVPAAVPAFSGATDVPATFAPTSAVATSTSVTASNTSTTSTISASTSSVPVHASSSTTSTVTITTGLPGPPRTVLLLGDSTGVALAEGLYRWAGEHPTEVQVASLARLGCGLVRNSSMYGDGGDRFRANCDHAFDVELPDIIRSGVPEIVVVMVTLPDVVDRTWSAQEGPLTPSDPRYLQREQHDYDILADELLASGVQHIVWMAPPPPSERWPQAKVKPIPATDWAAFLGTVERQATRHPDRVEVARLDEWMAAHEPPDGSMRPDGLHLAADAAFTVTEQFLGPLLLSSPRR